MAAGEDVGGWCVRVASYPGLTESAAVLKTFSLTLADDETLDSTTATLEGDGSLRAEMTIAEPREGHARELAVAAFRRGLYAAGIACPDVPGPDLIVSFIAPLPT